MNRPPRPIRPLHLKRRGYKSNAGLSSASKSHAVLAGECTDADFDDTLSLLVEDPVGGLTLLVDRFDVIPRFEPSCRRSRNTDAFWLMPGIP